MRGDSWKRAYVYEVLQDEGRVPVCLRLVHEGRLLDSLALAELEEVALRFDASLGLWQWLLVLRGDDKVRALPHDDALKGHAQLSATLRALPGFSHRAYAETLTSPWRRGNDSRAQLLWSRASTSTSTSTSTS